MTAFEVGMKAAVQRKLDQREEEQGLGRHVEDDATLDQVAHLLDANDTNANDGSAPEDAPVTTSDRQVRKAADVGS